MEGSSLFPNRTASRILELKAMYASGDFMPSRKSTEILLALLVYVVGTVVGTIGMNVMKWALDRTAKKASGARAARRSSVPSAAELGASDDAPDGASDDETEDVDFRRRASPGTPTRGSDRLRGPVINPGVPLQSRLAARGAVDWALLSAHAVQRARLLAATIRGFPPLWWVGLGAFLSGQLVLLPTFAYAKQSLLCSLGSVCFPVNLLFVSIVLRTRPPCLSWGAVCLIVAGDVMVVSSSSSHAVSPPASLHAMQSLWTLNANAPNVVYVCAKALLCAAGFAVPYFRERALRRAWRAENPAAVAAAAAMKRPGARSDGENAAVDDARSSNVNGFCFAIASATAGSECMTFVKCISLAFSDATARGDFSALFAPYFLLMLVLLAAMATWWGVRLQMALGKFDQLFIVSTMQVCWTLSTVLDGGMYFREFAGFSASESIAFIGGIAMIVGGVLVLAAAGDGRRELDGDCAAAAPRRGGGGVSGGGLGRGVSELIASDDDELVGDA